MMSVQSKPVVPDVVPQAKVTLALDEAFLLRQAMGDQALAKELLGLFQGQIDRLEAADFTKLDLQFEMHTLKGSAAAIGAGEIEHLASHWRALGPKLGPRLKAAFSAFRLASAAAP